MSVKYPYKDNEGNRYRILEDGSIEYENVEVKKEKKDTTKSPEDGSGINGLTGIPRAEQESIKASFGMEGYHPYDLSEAFKGYGPSEPKLDRTLDAEKYFDENLVYRHPTDEQGNPQKSLIDILSGFDATDAYDDFITEDGTSAGFPDELPSMTDNTKDPTKFTRTDRRERAKEIYDLYITEGDTSPANKSDLEDLMMEFPGKVKDIASKGWEGIKGIASGIGEAVSDYSIGIYDFDPYVAERYYMALMHINPELAKGYKDMYIQRKNLEKVKTSTGMTGNMAEQLRQKESDIAVKQEIAAKLGELKSGLADGTITKNDTKYNSIYTELMTMYGKLYNPPSRNEYEKMIDADIKSETLDLNKEKLTFDKEKELNDREQYAIDTAIKNAHSSKDKLDNMSTKLRGAVYNMNQAMEKGNLPAFLTGLKGFISGIDDSAVMGEEFQMFNSTFNSYKETIGGLLGGLLEASAGVTYDGTKVSGILNALNNTINALKESYTNLSTRANNVYKNLTGKKNNSLAISSYFSNLDVKPVTNTTGRDFVVKDAIDAKKVAELASYIIGSSASAVANIITGEKSDSGKQRQPGGDGKAKKGNLYD